MLMRVPDGEGRDQTKYTLRIANDADGHQRSAGRAAHFQGHGNLASRARAPFKLSFFLFAHGYPWLSCKGPGFEVFISGHFNKVNYVNLCLGPGESQKSKRPLDLAGEPGDVYSSAIAADDRRQHCLRSALLSMSLLA
jgi:hypothetical protein